MNINIAGGGISTRSWEHAPGSTSSGPFGPTWDSTVPGDKGSGYWGGNGRAKFEIGADLPAPNSQAGLGFDGLADAFAASL